MHLSFLLVALALIIPTLASSEEVYKNGYYFGRSADIVIDTDSHPVEVQLRWQLTKQHNGLRENVEQVHDVQVHNLVSRALGLPQVQLHKSHSLESVMDDSIPFNPLSPLSGNMLFSFEGVSSGCFPATTTTLGRTPVYTLTQTSRPYHPLSTMATVITGAQPRRHGVVNEREVKSTSSNLFDLSQALFDGVVVSGSGCRAFASLLSSHIGSDSYFWNAETSAFASINGNEPVVSVTKDNMASFIDRLGLSKTVSYTGTVAKIGNTNYDLRCEVDTSFFAEIAFVSAWGEQLNQLPASQRFFSFHFTSLASIATKYGRESPQFRTALEVVDATVSAVVSDEYAFEIVYLPSTQNTEAMQAVVSPIVSSVADLDSFPQIYLSDEGYDKQEGLCKQIRKALSTDFSDATVFCPLHTQMEKRAMADPIISLAPLTATIPEVLEFHYVFWTMMIVLVVLIWASYAIASIPPDESLLTASTYYKKGGKL